VSDTLDLDELDLKILNMLIKDARTRLKDIAKECGISSVSVLNRIRSLKERKVITGSTLFPDMKSLGIPVVATVGVVFDGNQDQEIFKMISELAYLVEPSPSVGEYDLCAFVFAKSLSDLDQMAYSIRKHFRASKVTINVWSGDPQDTYENIDLSPRNR
jgi:DNA-binding Lrp family transcriptional regulator